MNSLLLHEEKHAFLVGHNDVGFAVFVQVARRDLRANAAVVVDEMRDELRTTLAIALELKPIKVPGRRSALRPWKGRVPSVACR